MSSNESKASWSQVAVTDVTNYVIPAIDIIISAFIIVGNAFVIIAYARFSRLRTDVNLIIVNLSSADLMVAVAVVICRITLFLNHSSSVEVLVFNCLLKMALALVSICASIFFLLLMTAERYVKILYPFHYGKLVTHGRIMVAVVCIWVMTITAGFLFAYGFNVFEPEYTCIAAYVLEPAIQIYVIPAMVIFFLGGMILMYSRILYVARQQSLQIKQMNKMFHNQSETKSKSDYRLTVMLAYVVGFLTLTYIPLVVITIYGARSVTQVMYWDEYVPEDLLTFAIFERIIYTCVFCNSAVNPAIYHFKNPDFRRSFRQMLNIHKVSPRDGFSHSDTQRSVATNATDTTMTASFVVMPKY